MLLVCREAEKSLGPLLGISGFFERTRSKPVFKVSEAASPVIADKVFDDKIRKGYVIENERY
jgi:hypothetical protein